MMRETIRRSSRSRSGRARSTTVASRQLQLLLALCLAARLSHSFKLCSWQTAAARSRSCGRWSSSPGTCLRMTLEVNGDSRTAQPDAMEVPDYPVGVDKLNVVLTHTTADFDSLAAAVGLARVWQSEQPHIPCYVCLPRGSHPNVAHFLALHKNLFPVIALKDVSADQVHRVGLVDAQRKDRVGPAETLLDTAEESCANLRHVCHVCSADMCCNGGQWRGAKVHVFDHHFEKTSDIAATKLVIEKVGSVTTIIAELLQKGGLRLRDAEATLMALGVHSDTGSLTFESATSRDARALAWLMDQGASQAAISEYGHASLSPDQQSALADAFNTLQKRHHNGVTIGSALIDCDSYIKGMAVVAQNILEVSDSDVVLLAVRYPNKRGRAPNSLVLIGRANARAHGIDLNHLFDVYGGGGHPKASSASLRLDHDEDFERVPGKGPKGRLTAEEVVEGLVDRICCEQIQRQERAMDIMTAPVLTCDPSDSIDEAGRKLDRYGIRGMPVCKKGESTVVGVISKDIIRKAQGVNQGNRPVSGWMVTHIVAAQVDQTIAEVEELLVMNDLGRVPVLEGGKLVGLITRTDLLRQHQFYDGLHYHNKAFADPIDSPERKMLMELRKKLKKFDVD
ncbi:hypothetical protein JKP88DRAFT_265039 [Tribonema minus]|uniref:CBS domain-containing protein n=1 Tax=Tribonema minus TaxID=303371 RepID=A0A835YMN8_9STRA|nr:hypothetical protein JKP88DRAFT_265039 [Tribonema minus]